MVSQITDIKNIIQTTVNDESSVWFRVFSKMEKILGMDKECILWGSVAFSAIWLAFGFAAKFLCNLICFIIPAIISLQAIESGQDQSIRLYTYWITFGALSLIEYSCSFFVEMIPFYWLFKCVSLMYLLLPPPFAGAECIFKNYIAPLVHELRNSF